MMEEGVIEPGSQRAGERWRASTCTACVPRTSEATSTLATDSSCEAAAPFRAGTPGCRRATGSSSRRTMTGAARTAAPCRGPSSPSCSSSCRAGGAEESLNGAEEV